MGGTIMMTVGGWRQLTPVARFLVYVLRDFHDQGVMLVSSEQITTATGLPVDALKAAALVARDARFIEKVDGGIRLTALVCLETALATRPTLRKVKDESKLPPGFLRLWQIDPRGSARADAIREFVKISPEGDLLDLMVRRFAQDISGWIAEGRERDKMPHLRTWLHGRRWEDDVRVGPMAPAMSKRDRQNANAAREALQRRGFVPSAVAGG
jgi:hypothetical protein